MAGVCTQVDVLMSCFFFNDTATTEIYTLSLHDALPISKLEGAQCQSCDRAEARHHRLSDRKSTRLNSSHLVISYAVFCLKKRQHHHGVARPPHPPSGSARHEAAAADN